MAAAGRQDEGPARLLSIDGGGIRGLSALVLLEQIMDQANHHRRKLGLEDQLPWQMFDMICGTSTGGLIAIMLGRLRMSIEQCRTAYINFANQAFTPKNIISKVKNKATVGPQFKTGPLEEAIQQTIGDGWQTMLLKEDNDLACKVFVAAHQGNINEPVALRSYRHVGKPSRRLNEMHIWQACRATSAAVTFFESIDVNGSTFSDGGLYYNNPVLLLHNEAGEIWPGREQLVISLGTGLSGPRKFDPKLLSIAKDLGKIATDTEQAHDNFHRLRGGKAALDGRYFRFNVPGLGDFSMDETKHLATIRDLTESYLEGAEITSKASVCAERLAGGAYTVAGPVPKDPRAEDEAAGPSAADLKERMRRLRGTSTQVAS